MKVQENAASMSTRQEYRLSARIDAADAQYAEQLADYRQSVLLTLDETETYLLRYQQSHERAALLQRTTNSATQAVEQARDRYDQGFIGYVELLTAEQELTALRNNWCRARQRRYWRW